jgi:UDP-N-acetylglucosamine 2-epimerase
MVKTFIQGPFQIKAVPSEPFVFITLHRQPEASVDVFGAHFSNQLETIRTIARLVPVTHNILVKEHSHGIGDRGPSFYSKLNMIPGVKLVDPYADTFSFIDKADLILSISGTVCYEAAVLGKRAVTVAPMFFGPLLVRNGWNPYASSVNEVSNWLNTRDKVPSYDDRVNFMASVMAQTSEGIISDPSRDKHCIDKTNIENVSEAFLTMADGQEEI